MTLAQYIAALALAAKSKDARGILEASKKIDQLVKQLVGEANQRAASWYIQCRSSFDNSQPRRACC